MVTKIQLTNLAKVGKSSLISKCIAEDPKTLTDDSEVIPIFKKIGRRRST